MLVWNGCNNNLGRGIKRVVGAIAQYAPEGIEFTPYRYEAEIIIDHLVDGEFEHTLLSGIKHIAWQYTYKTSPTYGNWQSVWDYLDLVVSYYDLPTFPLYHTPLGCDTDMFCPLNVVKEFGIIATGYVAETEYIREAYEACLALDVDFCHVGADFRWGKHYRHFENVPDDVMCRLYNASHLAMATRKVEGFELPALEAAACGTLPICLDNEHYAWFRDLAWFIPETPRFTKHLTGMLDQVMREGNTKADKRRQVVVDEFRWQPIMERFWEVVLA